MIWKCIKSWNTILYSDSRYLISKNQNQMLTAPVCKISCQITHAKLQLKWMWFSMCFVCQKELKRDYKRLREDTLSLSWQVSCQSCGNTDSVIIIMKINCESKMKKSQLKIELRIVLFFFLCRILIKFNCKKVPQA